MGGSRVAGLKGGGQKTCSSRSRLDARRDDVHDDDAFPQRGAGGDFRALVIIRVMNNSGVNKMSP